MVASYSARSARSSRRSAVKANGSSALPRRRFIRASAVEIAALPERIRGFGAVKRRAAEAARAERERLLVRLREDAAALPRAA